MNINFALAILIFSSKAISASPSCPKGEYPVHAHHRNGYTRADGTAVKSANVNFYCKVLTKNSEFGVERFRSGVPTNWPHKSENTSFWTEEEKANLTYDEVLTLKIGITIENDVITKFGVPYSRIEKNDIYTLTYNDHNSGNQRASFNFLISSNKLSGILWLPKKNEKEFILSEAKESFKNAQFKEIIDDEENPHSESKNTLYIDENSGVSIRYNSKNNFVEAIAKFTIADRSPTSFKKTKKIPYTIGDEQ